MCGGEKRGNTRALTRLASPRLAWPGRVGQAARVHDVRVEWSAKLAPHPCADAASFCSFVLLREIRICFVLETFRKIRCVKTAWSPDKLHGRPDQATYHYINRAAAFTELTRNQSRVCLLLCTAPSLVDYSIPLAG